MIEDNAIGARALPTAHIKEVLKDGWITAIASGLTASARLLSKSLLQRSGPEGDRKVSTRRVADLMSADGQ